MRLRSCEAARLRGGHVIFLWSRRNDCVAVVIVIVIVIVIVFSSFRLFVFVTNPILVSLEMLAPFYRLLLLQHQGMKEE